jgi:hypothetical protein
LQPPSGTLKSLRKPRNTRIFYGEFSCLLHELAAVFGSPLAWRGLIEELAHELEI